MLWFGRCQDRNRNQNRIHTHASKQDLVQDADIVAVAVKSLTVGRERFVQAGRKEEASLLRQLEPQWEANDTKPSAAWQRTGGKITPVPATATRK